MSCVHGLLKMVLFTVALGVLMGINASVLSICFRLDWGILSVIVSTALAVGEMAMAAKLWDVVFKSYSRRTSSRKDKTAT